MKYAAKASWQTVANAVRAFSFRGTMNRNTRLSVASKSIAMGGIRDTVTISYDTPTVVGEKSPFHQQLRPGTPARVVGEIAFHEKAGRSQGDSFAFAFWSKDIPA
jgi:hypothetical protein